MALFKNLSLGGVLRLLGTLLGVGVMGMLLFTACSRLGGAAPGSAGIPTPAGAAAAQAAPANPAATLPPANLNPAPTAAQVIAPPAPPPAAVPAGGVPTVQPVIVNENAEVRVPQGNQPQQPAQPVDVNAQGGLSPAPVLDTQSDAACGQRVSHVVAPGENLFRIAYRYRSTTYSIARLNGISNTRRLSVGRNLVVVTCDRAGGGYTNGGGAGRRYVVQPGDNLFRIGIRFGTSAEQIRSVNNLPGYLISVGQILSIP